MHVKSIYVQCGARPFGTFFCVFAEIPIFSEWLRVNTGHWVLYSEWLLCTWLTHFFHITKKVWIFASKAFSKRLFLVLNLDSWKIFTFQINQTVKHKPNSIKHEWDKIFLAKKLYINKFREKWKTSTLSQITVFGTWIPPKQVLFIVIVKTAIAACSFLTPAGLFSTDRNGRRHWNSERGWYKWNTYIKYNF